MALTASISTQPTSNSPPSVSVVEEVAGFDISVDYMVRVDIT